MKKSIFLVALIFLIFQSFGQEKGCPILPTPVTYQTTNEFISIPKTIIVDTVNLNLNNYNQLKELGKTYHNLDFTLSKEQPLIVFRKLKNVKEDSYSINVGDNIIISYSSQRSCYYAIHSLMQLIQGNEQELQINKCFVKDYPNFQWRGLHLDVARHFFTVEEVKRYIDLMAIYKFNTFHWHLTDDQGWRIEIKKYPKLTEIGAWRDSTVENHYSTRPRTYERKRYGGFYTQEQIKDVVQYAADRYITIVPEIEMPGHARAALAAYPELSCTGKQQGVEGLWGVFDDIFCSNEKSILFLQDVLSEVVELFPGEYIHIGGDEAPKTRWKNCPKCQHIIKANGLKDEHELQSYFIKRMDTFLSLKGKKIMGWDEILEGGLSPNAAVMSWRGFEGGLEAAKQKHYVVMSPGSHCYFDHYQGKSKDEPLAIGGYTSLEKVYEFNPVPKEMTPDEAAFVLGAQANLWTEYIPNFKQLEYMAFPRAIALSQVLWSSNRPNYNSFLSNLVTKHFPFLEKLNVNYSKSILKKTIKTVRLENGIELNSQGLEIKNGQINESTNSFSIIRTKRKIKKVNYVSSTVKDELNPNEEIVTITNHLGLGAKINYITQPSPKYNESDVILVDGQYGSRPWKGNEWIGFDADSIILEIDLGKRTKIKDIELSFLQDEGSWIHTPDMISIQTILPKNGMNAGQGCGPSLDGYAPCPEKWNFDLNSKAEKIRITIYGIGQIPMGFPGEGNKPWIFMDEITIR